MDKKKKRLNILQVVFFLLILGAGTAAVLFGAFEGKTYSELEKRELVSFPDLNRKELLSGEFERNFDEALADHVWGRDLFVTAKTWVQVALGEREIDGVYIDGERLIETYKDSDFDEDQIHENISDVSEFLTFMQRALGDGHVNLLLVPSKYTLYREDIPGYMPMSRRADTLAEEIKTSLAESLMKNAPTVEEEEEDVPEEDESEDDFSDTDSDEDIDFDFDEGDPEAEDDMTDETETSEEEETEEEDAPEDSNEQGTATNAASVTDENTAREMADRMVTDLRPVLTAHRTEPIYYLTDHHWTTLGAAYAYQTIRERLEHFSSGVTDAGTDSIEKSETEIVASDFLGTDYNRIHYYKKPDEIRRYSIPEADAASIEINDSGDHTTRDSIYDKNALETADKYNYFFSGNYSQVTVNTGMKNGKTLLIVKDSYSNSLVPFLCKDYEKIIMIDLRYVNASIYDYLPADKKPDDVMIVYNEEKFMQDTHQGYLK